MKSFPEDGSLKEITSCVNHEITVIIIRRPGELKKPGETTYTLATFDRTKEGEKWPGDEVLEKLIPGLPEMKALEVNKPGATVKTKTPLRDRIKKKVNQKPMPKDNYLTTHRSKPPHKKFHPDRSEKPLPANDIDPWINNPWENRAFFSEVNAARSATSLISDGSFNNFPSQDFPSSSHSQLFPPRASNNIRYILNNAYEKNVRPTRVSNNLFSNNHRGLLNRPQLAARIPGAPCPSFPPPVRYSWPQNEFHGPHSVLNADFNGPTQNPVLLSNTPIPRIPGLLGDSPFSNMPINRNLIRFPETNSSQFHLEGNTAAVLPRDEENTGDQNSFISNTKNCSMEVNSYNNYGRISRPNFDNYTNVDEISQQELHDSYEHPSSTGDSRNDSFRDTNEINYSMFQNPDTSVNNDYENQYINSYKPLNHNYPNDNSKNISLNATGNFYETNYRGYKRPPAGVSHYESGYMEIDNDNIDRNNYEIQVSSISGNSFMNNNHSKDESVIHVSDSAVVYDQNDFQNEGYSANSSIQRRSNFNSVSRFNRQNFHTKNIWGTKKKWFTNKYTNYSLNRGGFNQGRRNFRNWRGPRK